MLRATVTTGKHSAYLCRHVEGVLEQGFPALQRACPGADDPLMPHIEESPPHEVHPAVRGWWPQPSTGVLAIVGASLWTSGFFLLAAAGGGYGPDVLALIFAGAALLAVPVLLLASLVAASEGVVGRAWASGFGSLTRQQRRPRGVAVRGVRYAGFLWLANGGALWFATLASRF